MKLFLCSHFSSVGSLIKEEIDNKKVAFIPTASLREGYTGYVGSARKLFNKLGATVTEIDISTEAYLTIQSVFEDADVGLDLLDFYVLPHYLTAPFKKVTEKIMTEFSDLNLCPINNRQGIVIDGEGSKVICKD